MILISILGEVVVLGNATEDKHFERDQYLSANQIKSVLCMPIMKQEKLHGVLYVENNLLSFAFPANRVTVLTILVSQMAISLGKVS